MQILFFEHKYMHGTRILSKVCVRIELLPTAYSAGAEKHRLWSCLKRWSVPLPVYTASCPHRVLMPFWRDYGTLTDTQLIVELGRTKNTSHLSILGLKISIKHSYTFLQNCVACFHCHYIVMAALCNRGAIIFSPCSFFLPSFYLFFPRLISATVDWMSAILLHMTLP